MKKKREWHEGDRVVITTMERSEEGSNRCQVVYKYGTIRHLYARGVGVEVGDKVYLVRRKQLLDPEKWAFAVKEEHEPLAIRQLSEGVTEIRYAPLG